MKKLKLLLIISLIIFILLVLLLFFVERSDMTFNEFFVMKQSAKYRTFSFGEAMDAFKARYSAGLFNLFGDKPSNENLNYSNSDEFFKYIFMNLPSYVMVYPTETYFYYVVKLSDINIAGNIRLLDAGSGVLHIGYFEQDKPYSEKIVSGADDFDKGDGVSIERINDFKYKVTFNKKTVTFKLSDFIYEIPTSVQLLPEEEFVAQILDESGIRFYLLFNNKTNSFYYVFNEENGINDKFSKIASKGDYYVGKETGFVYYQDKDYGRKILIGVYQSNIMKNNYFDGPFDQVPPRLPLKEKLLAAYPYANYRGGIDEHGNFNQIEGSRMAISPYYDYNVTVSVVEYLSRCDNLTADKSLFWSCLTYEWKKDFHKYLESTNYTDPYGYISPSKSSENDSLNTFIGVSLPEDHLFTMSQGWPANHEGEVSMSWPRNHGRELSSTWPKNHLGSQSVANKNGDS